MCLSIWCGDASLVLRTFVWNHGCICFLFFLIVHVIVRLYLSVSGFLVLQEDPVLLAPQTKEQKLGIATIKVTTWNCFMVFYRLFHWSLLCSMSHLADTHSCHCYLYQMFVHFAIFTYSSHLLLMLNNLSGEAKTWFSIFMDKDVILAVTICINN